MPLFGQPTVAKFPPDLSFTGKVALVTGANTGLGLATSLHLLQLGVSRLVIAVRTRTNGETAKAELLADPIVASLASQPEIAVYELDLASEKSVIQLGKDLRKDLPRLDIAILNAGMYAWTWNVAPETGREMEFQVNYISTALLSLVILPLLQSSSSIMAPSRITFVGSEMALGQSIPTSSQPIFESLSSSDGFVAETQYGRSKLALAMFVHSLSRHVDSTSVIINNVCPGLVKTSLTRDVSWILRQIVPIFYAVKGARTPEAGGRLVVSATTSDKDTHGTLLTNARITSVPFVQSQDSQDINAALWKETIDLANGLVPSCVEFGN